MPKKKKKRRKPKGPIGFARLSRFARQQIGRRGGLTAAKKARRKPHRWTRAEAARAARKGHEKTPGPRNPHGVQGKPKGEDDT